MSAGGPAGVVRAGRAVAAYRLGVPRLRQVSRADAPAGIVTTMYDLLFGERDPVAEPGTATGTRGDWWTVFALVPDVLRHAVDGFALYQSPDRVLDPQLRELAQLRAGWARGSQFVFSQHCKQARVHGVPEEQIAAVPAWAAAGLWSDEQRAVLAYTDALVLGGGRVADDLMAALRRHLSDEAVLELTYITAMYDMHAVIARALQLEQDDRPDPVVESPDP
jgi:AhpD family alkylhydroperoxidase